MRFNQLKQIVNSNDPLDLLAAGTPKDEYNSEVKSILKRLKKGQSKLEVEKIVVEEFNKWFGVDLMEKRKDILNKIAQEIIKQTVV